MRWSKTFIPTLRDNPADAEFPCQFTELIQGKDVTSIGSDCALRM